MARPTGVTILAVLSFICSALLLSAAVGTLLMGTVGLAAMSGKGAALGDPLAMLGAFAGVMFLVLAALYIACGVGLLKLANWARMLTVVLVALGLLFALMGVFKAMMPLMIGALIWQLIVIAIDVWILMYLFKPHVKQAFGAA
ncbi:MAG TPA: hypothetical protein VGT03_12240 [Candidatus Acidoferrales bacterium]|nr:hypothetical protein [Candidatus Acidoferrales bacterium]